MLLQGWVVISPFTQKNKLQTLESSLKDTEREKSELTSKIEEFYEEADVQTPGVKAKDFTKAIMEANKV